MTSPQPRADSRPPDHPRVAGARAPGAGRDAASLPTSPRGGLGERLGGDRARGDRRGRGLGGRRPATWWVEYGPTTAYGQATSPASLPADSPKRAVSVVLRSLSAAVAYHARVVVASAVGRVGSPDVAFTTLADALAARVAAAGDIACPQRGRFQRRPGNRDDVPADGVSNAILAGDYNAVLPLGDEQYTAGTAAAFAASYHPELGPSQPDRASRGRQSRVREPGRRAVLRVLRRGRRHARAKGWYSYELGSWHVIALNSNCAFVPAAAAPARRRRPGSAPTSPHTRSAARSPTGITPCSPRARKARGRDEHDLGRPRELPAQISCSTATITTTSASRPRARPASATTRTACASSSSAPAAQPHVASPGARGQQRGERQHQLRLPRAHPRQRCYGWRFVAAAPDGFSDSGTASCH